MGLLYTAIGWGLNNITNKQLVDVLSFTAADETVRADTSVSTQKMAIGVGFSNYIYNNPMQISLSGVVFKNFFADTKSGEYDKGYAIVILEALRLQQIVVPIFLRSTVFTGLVQMLNYNAHYSESTVGIDIDFQELPLFQPFITSAVMGNAEKAKPVSSVPLIKGT